MDKSNWGSKSEVWRSKVKVSVEFSEYNIELVDLIDFRYLNSTQLSDDRLDRSTRL